MPYDPSEPSPIPGLPDTAWPTNDQLSGIGAVAATWSWLEMALESLLCALTRTDDALSQSFTGDLSPDNRVKALRRLVTTWELILGAKAEPFAPLFAELREFAQWFAKRKAERNRIVHTLWMRTDDSRMFGWKHKTMPHDGVEAFGGSITRAETIAFSQEVGAWVARLNAAEKACHSLPVLPPPSPDMLFLPGLASLLAPYRRPKAP